MCAGRRDFAALASRINEPLLAPEMTAAERKRAEPVFHLTVAAAKDPKTGELAALDGWRVLSPPGASAR